MEEVLILPPLPLALLDIVMEEEERERFEPFAGGGTGGDSSTGENLESGRRRKEALWPQYSKVRGLNLAKFEQLLLNAVQKSDENSRTRQKCVHARILVTNLCTPTCIQGGTLFDTEKNCST